jgi:L-arabinose isomerase
MERKRRLAARVGVFGVGLAAYWPQFPGLRERLVSYQRDVETYLTELGAAVVSAGLVDTPEAGREAGDRFARENLDLLVCSIGTYATSSQVLPVVQRQRVPVLVLNLQPVAALDYERTDTAEWLANCTVCSVPELAGVFARARIPFNVVTGTLSGDERAWSEIGEWVTAAGVARTVQRARFGFLGHTYPGMLDMHTDIAMHQAQLGTHIELLEMEDLHTRVEAATDADVAAKEGEIRATFTFAEPGSDAIAAPVTDDALNRAARIACGLDRLADDFALDGLAYYYRGLDNGPFEQLAAGLIVGNSLLTARGIPAAGEGDLQTCVAMLIMDRLGVGGSFAEFMAMDFNDDILLMGHDGPGHLAISAAPPTLRALEVFHGKRGGGLSVEFTVRTGPVTILGLTQTADGRLKLIAAEGECVPGPVLRTGNTNSRLKFPGGPAAFIERWCAEGPTHHVALGLGHQTSTLRKLSRVLGLDLAVVE